MQLIGINNLIILNKLFAKLAQLIRINNFLEYSLIRIIRVCHISKAKQNLRTQVLIHVTKKLCDFVIPS